MSTNNLALIKTGDSTFDKIFAHFIDEKKYKLSPTQEKIKERWLAVWTLRLSLHSVDQVVSVYKKMFDGSRAQAFRDIRNAERLFGQLSKTSRDGKQAVFAEYVHNYLQLAVEAQDLKAIGKALDLMERAYDLDKSESNLFNPEKLIDKQVKFSISKRTMELAAEMLAHGSIDLNSPPTIEVEHEDIG